jgi:hypothetical protein
MVEQMSGNVPQGWREIAELLVAPIVWIPSLQRFVIHFFADSHSVGVLLAKVFFLLFPVLLGLAAVWCTQLSLYTLPFRARRVAFVSTMLVTWWDGARMVWLYWVSMFRVVTVTIGWLFSLARLALKMLLEALHQVILIPFTVTGRMTNQYFQPGVPWVAFVMLVFWCMLETTIFTYTLSPTISEVLSDMVGAEAVPRSAGAVLWIFLFLLIMGSFACVQAMVDAVRKREFKFIAQIVLVELFVMMFEVVFLYRELVDAIAPWIAQQSGDTFRPGIGFTMTVATFGWVGVRGMTWFLFARYGTPPLLSFISRQPMAATEGPPVVPEQMPVAGWWRAPLADFKSEIGWLHERSDELVEYLALPALHLLAAAINFGMVVMTDRPLFSLPFKGLKDVLETREALAGVQVLLRKREAA